MCGRDCCTSAFLAAFYLVSFPLHLPPPLPPRVGKEEGVDTEPFRHAVWHYIQSIKGIRRDDYNYKEVNKLLTISFKTYIRMVRRGRGREKEESCAVFTCVCLACRSHASQSRFV